MCSSNPSSSSSHFANFVHRTTGACLKPGRGSTVEPIRLNSKETPKNGECHPDKALVQRIVMPHTTDEILHTIFSTITTLKVAYINLQAAHVPYDIDKLQKADGEIIRAMKQLSELKHLYKESAVPAAAAARFGGGEESKSQDAAIRSLKAALENLGTKNRELQARVGQMPVAGAEECRIRLLEENILKARDCAAGFTKCLVSFMKAAEWDVDAAAKSIEPGIDYSMPGHKKLAFQSYVCARMFQGFEHETFFLTGTMSSIMDPQKHRNECLKYFESFKDNEPSDLACMDFVFGKFCMKKFVQVVHPKMEESFFGNFDHRNKISKGANPRSPFYNVFVRFAKAVWLLHKAAFSLEPPVSIFNVNPGVEFDEVYMENLNFHHGRAGTYCNDREIEKLSLTQTKSVGFTVMPGFRVGSRVISGCQVYAI